MSDAVGRATAFLKTLAHEGRLEILCQLIDGERTVTELEEALGLGQVAVSQQLMRLRAEGLVGARRAGRNIYYRLERPEVSAIIAELQRAFCPAPGAPDGG
jgi:ArsR family transcriptional regulator, virulence genes transcriptional regulator